MKVSPSLKAFLKLDEMAWIFSSFGNWPFLSALIKESKLNEIAWEMS